MDDKENRGDIVNTIPLQDLKYFKNYTLMNDLLERRNQWYQFRSYTTRIHWEL